MENASKALLMAAAVIIAVMLLSLVFVFFDDMAGYFTEKHNVTMTQQTMEFNNKFANYGGKTIRGNELISVMNRIIDYNNYQSEMLNFERVIITIDLQGRRNDLRGIDTSGSRLIFDNEITNEGGTDEALSDVSALAGEIVSSDIGIELGLTEKKLQKLSSRLYDLLEYNNDTKLYVAEKINDILDSEYTTSEIDGMIEDLRKITCKYNQLSNFKKAKFKCKNVSYNEEEERINKIEFEVVLGDDGTIKLD